MNLIVISRIFSLVYRVLFVCAIGILIDHQINYTPLLLLAEKIEWQSNSECLIWSLLTEFG
ncbi:MAG: hypothetical protein M3P98_04270, partial [bacterium]|nr:hypothetical protein [bacterium]